jgi:hypothetical protein
VVQRFLGFLAHPNSKEEFKVNSGWIRKSLSYFIPQNLRSEKKPSTGVVTNWAQFPSSWSKCSSDLSNAGAIHVPQRKYSHYCVTGVMCCPFQMSQLESVFRISHWRVQKLFSVNWPRHLGNPFNPTIQPWGPSVSEVVKQSVPLQNGTLASFVVTLSHCHFPTFPTVLSKPWVTTS